MRTLFRACGNRRNTLEYFPGTLSTARFLHKMPWCLPSHGSTGLCPYIPSSYVSKVWRPIAFSGRVWALIGQELGSPCFVWNPTNESIYVTFNILRSLCASTLLAFSGINVSPLWTRPIRILATFPISLNTECCFFICFTFRLCSCCSRNTGFTPMSCIVARNKYLRKVEWTSVNRLDT